MTSVRTSPGSRRPSTTTIALVQVARASFIRTARQPAQLVLLVTFYVVILVAFAALWKASLGDERTVEGYDFVAILHYLAAAEAAVCAVPARLFEEIGDAISDGTVESELLRPASVVAIRIADQLGRAVAKLATLVLVGLVLATALTGTTPGATAAVASTVAAALAVAINITFTHALAAASFWFRGIKATWFLNQKFVFIFGGMLLPLQFLPSAMEKAAWVLPYWTMTYAPASMLAGHLQLWLFAGQLAWLVVAVGFAVAMFRAGERRLVGGPR